MGRLPQAFATIPTQPLEIRRVPPDIQDGASNGYYNRATLDGSRPAIYWINLKSTGDWPKYSLPSLTYHEGVPGHHLQISLAQESKDIPMLRKISFYNSYREGGDVCENSPTKAEADGTSARLSPSLLSARRGGGDTAQREGMEPREGSRLYDSDHRLPAPARAARVERYCVSIGQEAATRSATRRLRARDKVKAMLGPRVDLKQSPSLKEGASR